MIMFLVICKRFNKKKYTGTQSLKNFMITKCATRTIVTLLFGISTSKARNLFVFLARACSHVKLGLSPD